MCANICLSWFVYQQPEKHLTLLITGVCSLIGSIFDLPAWLMSSPGCKVIPRLTVSPNFSRFCSFKTAGVHEDVQHIAHTHKRCFLRSIFVSLCLDINTNTEAPWQLSLGNQCSPEVMATGTRWGIRRWRSVSLTHQPGSAFLSLISTPTLIKPSDLMSLWSDEWLGNFGTFPTII